MTYRRLILYIVPLGFLSLIALDLILRLVFVDEVKVESAYLQDDFIPLFEPDAYGKIYPNLSLSLSAGDSKAIEITTNALGMRMGDIHLEKNPEVTRIAVMGDSMAFGWNLPAEKTFPALLKSCLTGQKEKCYEILNFAAPGFTSLHLIKQYESIVHNFKPDVLILSIGFFDSFESRLSEEEIFSIFEENGISEGMKGFENLLDKYSCLGHWLAQRKINRIHTVIEQRIAERIKSNQWSAKVSLNSFKTYISAILDHHIAKGGKAILLNSNLLNFKITPTLKAVADKYKIPLLDIRSYFETLGAREGRRKQTQLNLARSGLDYFNGNSQTTYLIRMYNSSPQALTSGVFMNSRSIQSEDKPQQFVMYDDGSHGDERARDHVWSHLIHYEKPRDMQFSFSLNKEGNQASDDSTYERSTSNLQFYHHFTPPKSEESLAWLSPVYQMNYIPFANLLQSKSSPFPNELGHKMIARHLARMLNE